MGAAYVVHALLAFVVALATTPVVRRLALRVRATDRGGGRRIHSGEVPRLGGIVIFTAGLLALWAGERLGFGALALLDELGWNLGALLAGTLIAFAAGLYDDVRGLGWSSKLLAQGIAAWVAVEGGYGFVAVTHPFTDATIALAPFEVVITLLWVLAITNAVNLIDGLDGLASGVALIACLTLFAIAIIEQRPDAALLEITLAGALAGFLLFNFNPASIFLGDSGSLALGYLLAILSIQSRQKGATAILALAPVLALGLPLMEVIVTTLRRSFVSGVTTVMRADRDHIHHRLLERGFTQRRAVLVLYATAVVFSVLALLAVIAHGAGKAILVAAAAVIMAVAVRRLGYRMR